MANIREETPAMTPVIMPGSPQEQAAQARERAETFRALQAGGVADMQFRDDMAARAAAEAVQSPAGSVPPVPSYAEISASVAHLVDTAVMETARADYEKAWARQQAVEGEVQQAEAALAEAVRRRDGLAEASEAGGGMTAQDVHAAEATIREAEAALAFARNRRSVVANIRDKAEATLAASSGVAYAPVLQHGIDLRLDAAVRIDRARAELAAAERAFGIATRVCRVAIDRGARLPDGVAWPGDRLPRHAAAEAAAWKRPLPAAA
jgi:hypothetical protein